MGIKEKAYSALDVCEGNWQSAEVDEDEALSLVLREVELGFVREWHGTIDQARERWTHIAVGKHGVRKNPGKEARLVLDSTAPGVNNGVTILEKKLSIRP